MHPKITSDHLGRGAVVYIRQSTIGQVAEHTESQRRQYALADSARAYGFASVTVIDDDLGRSGSGFVERPGFQKLVASVCSGSAGAVFCIEASRLARNGRDWHHLIDLCALVGTLVIDPDGTYDPRLVDDRLLLGLKGTMSEYELSLQSDDAADALVRIHLDLTDLVPAIAGWQLELQFSPQCLRISRRNSALTQGTQRWNPSAIWKIALPGTMLPRRFAPRSTASR
jgi:hypothetical protein